MGYQAITSFDNYIQANIVLLRLQDEGINCHLENEYSVTVGPFLSPLIGGIRLLVHDAQVERAQSILDNLGKEMPS